MNRETHRGKQDIRAAGFALIELLVVVASISLLAVLYVLSTQQGYRYRYCGHRPEFAARVLAAFPYWQLIKGADRLADYITIHGCSGERAVLLLVQLNSIQGKFQVQSGRYAYSLSELQAVGSESFSTVLSNLSQFHVEYDTSPESWCAYVTKQVDLPGHYLVLSSGVYFCESRKPTTNDTALVYCK